MLRRLSHLLPEWGKKPLRPIVKLIELTANQSKKHVKSIYYFMNPRWCPVCEKASRKFQTYGIVPRKDAQCVHCGALERHRFVWVYFSRMTNLFDGTPKRMLHVAPEICFESKLRNQLGQGYITADLHNPRAMVKMDITDIQYPDGYFDIIYCSHVLEHVQDDKRAMREFYRVLKPDGWAILLVPITRNITFEDSSIVDRSERLRVFGQENHVRRYGTDYIDRLREAGFKVKISCVSDIFEKSDIVRIGLAKAKGNIFYCTKAKI